MKLTPFRNRILTLNSALSSASFGLGSIDQLSTMEELAYSHVQWYNEQGQQSLTRFMASLDSEQTVRDDSDSNKLIYDGIFNFMNSIVAKIAEKKPQLTGRLVKMGSAYNHMKINQPDEFDFTFELDLNKLLNENAHIRKITSDRNRLLVLVDFEGERPDVAEFDIVGYPEDPELDEQLDINGNKDAHRYKSMLSEHGDIFMLNTEAIAFALFNVLDSVVSNLDLPANWSHGGYNYPNYSGLRLNIPAYLIQFAYHSPGTETPLMISVDFAPVLKLPNNLRYQSGDLVDEFLDESGYIEYPWLRLGRGTVKGCFNGQAEEKWLSTYAPDSIPKIVERVCKALHNMVKLNTPRYLSKMLALRIADLRKLRANDSENADQKMNACMFDMKIEDYTFKMGELKSDTDYATVFDVNEAVGENHYVPSYIFKRIVMILMALDESQGRKWTLNDLPDLVLSVFMIINDLIISVNQATPVFSESRHTRSGGVIYMKPRSDIAEKQPSVGQQVRMTEQLEIQLDHFQNKYEKTDIYARSRKETDLKKCLKWYFCLHKAIREGTCDVTAKLFLRNQFNETAKTKGLDDGIERVLHLLKCVAAGESKAFIKIYRNPNQDEEFSVEDYLITRKELSTLMKNRRLSDP